jgi:hypothetical protein
VVTVKPFAPQLGSPVPQKFHGDRWDVSIDPGAHTGWALFVTHHGVFGKRDIELAACGVGRPPFGDQVVIELPQAYPSSPVPTNDLITLAFLAGRLLSHAHAPRNGEGASLVRPHDWKGNLPKGICAARVIQKLSADEIRVVNEAERVVPKGQRFDMLDAIGIGLYAFRGVKL